MAHYNKIAKKLGLKDIENPKQLGFGEVLCEDCGTKLRLGEEILPKDKVKKIYPNIFSYCPKCKKRINVVFVPRFPNPPIEFETHKDLGIQKGGVIKRITRIIGPGGKGLPEDAHERRM